MDHLFYNVFKAGVQDSNELPNNEILKLQSQDNFKFSKDKEQTLTVEDDTLAAVYDDNSNNNLYIYLIIAFVVIVFIMILGILILYQYSRANQYEAGNNISSLMVSDRSRLTKNIKKY